MAVIKYTGVTTHPNAADLLADISAYSLQVKAMLSALGDYWTAYYRDLEPLAVATTGSVAAISKEYTHLLDIVRASNILDVPIMQADQFDLLTVRQEDVLPVYAPDGNGGTVVDYYLVAFPGLINTDYLTSTLFESQVVLKNGVHYEVVPGKGYKFYVDLFGDENISNFVYEVGEGQEKRLLLWACDIAFNSTVIYERYGCFLYKKHDDSEQYKWLVSALMRFYENTKSLKCIQDVFNILYGIPYTRYKDETITEIYYVDKNLQRITGITEEPFICIETDKASYYTYTFSELSYNVGDVVPQFSLLATVNRAEDYISHPGWWEDVECPPELVSGYNNLTLEEKNELIDKILKHNLVHLVLHVSFDTYKTYLQQIGEFFKIIESGFPVYLYPVVTTVFRVVFIDQVDIEEEFRILLMQMRLKTYYDWGKYLKFNGEIPYYMEPSQTHGRYATTEHWKFDGERSYDYPASYMPTKTEGADPFSGDKPYESDWKYSHDNSNEWLTITKLGHRTEDKYPWDTAPGLEKLVMPKYSNMYKHDGAITFGQVVSKYDNEYLEFSALAAPMFDTVEVAEVFSKFGTRWSLSDTVTVTDNMPGVTVGTGFMDTYSGAEEDFTLQVQARP